LQTVCAQNADDFFHTGAQAYLTNNIATAKDQVAKGLKLFPDDVKLKKLDELLKQQQQQNQQQQQQKQSQQKQSQSKQDQQKQQSEKQKEQQKQQEKEKQQQQKNQNHNQNQQQQAEKQPQKENQTPPGQMSPEEAKRLLDSQKGDEQLLPASQKEKPHDRDHPLKDW